MRQDHKTFDRDDLERVVNAQTYKNQYYPRNWLSFALAEGWSPDDICGVIATSNDILTKMQNDRKLPVYLRCVCGYEVDFRRKSGLPASGCAWIPSNKNNHAGGGTGAFDHGGETSLGYYLSFDDLIVNNTANTMSVFSYIVREVRDKHVKSQSEKLAQRLEFLGIPAYRKNQGSFSKVGLLTDLDGSLPLQFANILLIPSVAISKRSSLRKELSFWMENKLEGAEYLRYLVVTGGQNVPFYGDLRGHHGRMCRRISEAFKVMNERYGAEIYLRTTEQTIGTDGHSMNQHFNILYKIPYLSENKFSQFLSELLKFLGCQAKDSGVLKSVDEVIKYVTKPNDIDGMSDDVLSWYYHEMKKVRLFHAYGSLQKFRKELAESRHRIVFDHKSKHLKLVKKRQVNDHDLFTKHEFDGEFNGETFASLLSERALLQEEAWDEKREFSQEEKDRADAEENKIVGLMLPHFAFLNLSEPCLIVRNFTRNPETDIGQKALKHIERMQAELHSLVSVKLSEIGCQALITKDFRSLRAFHGSGNRDIKSVDGYILDTLHHNSRKHHSTSRRRYEYRPPDDVFSFWEEGLKAPVSS